MVWRVLAALLAIGGALLAAQAADASPALQLFPSAPCPASTAHFPTTEVCHQARGEGSLQARVRTQVAPRTGDRVVTLRASRFESATVEFGYADGHFLRQKVHAGDYGTHWRIGGSLHFEAPRRAAPLTSVSLGIEGAHWQELLNAYLGPVPAEDHSDRTSMLVGATLALLLLSVLINVGTGIGLKRAEPVWNAAWAACVLGWALMWTQAILLVAPGLAGTAAARLATAFATTAIFCAGAHLLVAAGSVRRWVRSLLEGSAAFVLVAGWSAAVVPGAWLPAAAAVLNIAVLTATIAVAITCVATWRRSGAVRHFAWSFTVPIAAVLWSTFVDEGITGDDDHGMYMVLVACALQTLWLALAAARQMLMVRRDRDAARQSEAQLAALAETDPLTGLLNRRGFIARAEERFNRRARFALVLLDLDHFKSINDRHGHQAGDDVLRAVATVLNKARGTSAAVAGRLGGEEFGLLVRGDRGRGTILAEQLRLTLANLPIAAGSANLCVTASFGVADVQDGPSWNALYKLADQALYRAKLHGRNTVRCATIDAIRAA